MATRELMYRTGCGAGCRGHEWHPLTIEGRTTLDGAIAIEPLRYGISNVIAWDAANFPHPVPLCPACDTTTYVYIVANEWLGTRERPLVLRPYEHGLFHGYTPPPPVHTSGLTVSAHIFMREHGPEFWWSVQQYAPDVRIPRAHPTDAEHTALLDLLATHGPRVTPMLADLVPTPGAPMLEAITAIDDALR